MLFRAGDAGEGVAGVRNTYRLVAAKKKKKEEKKKNSMYDATATDTLSGMRNRQKDEEWKTRDDGGRKKQKDFYSAAVESGRAKGK